MKHHTRTAWTSSGRQESVAEHSWRLSLLALLVARRIPSLNALRILELCLVHDLGEAIEGDISAPLQSPTDGKGAAEERTVAELSALLPDDDGAWVTTLWREYNDGATPEARAVKALDKIETILQHNQGRNPDDFDFSFNLDYGAALPRDHELIDALRAIADEQTRARASQTSHQNGPREPGPRKPGPQEPGPQ